MFEIRIEKNINPNFTYMNLITYHEYRHPQDEVCQVMKYDIIWDDLMMEHMQHEEYRIKDIFSDADLIPYPTP